MRALALTLTCLSGDDLNDCCDEGFDDDNHDGDIYDNVMVVMN